MGIYLFYGLFLCMFCADFVETKQNKQSFLAIIQVNYHNRC